MMTDSPRQSRAAEDDGPHVSPTQCAHLSRSSAPPLISELIENFCRVAVMLSATNPHSGKPPVGRVDHTNEARATGVHEDHQQQHQQPQEVPSTKRRRVRKGTRSCWECKRRKIRCLFARPDDATCVGCQHRGTLCVGQEMPEELLSPARKGNSHLSNRIARIEEVMKEWLEAQPPGSGAGAITHEDALQTSAKPLPLHLPTPAESLSEPPAHGSSVLPTPYSHGRYGDGLGDIESTALSHLQSALPCPTDVQILLRESARPSLYTEVANTQPRSRLTRETLSSVPTLVRAEDLLGSPAHPVLLARQMILFAITLQCPCGEEVLGLLEPPSVLMRRLMNAATMWVTARNEMQGTVEALICIILEGIFETNAGNLRSAWAVYRRALTGAQLMGVHRSPRPRLPRIDPTLVADPECLWFRIVYMDRYLSLLLGLPQGTTDQTMRVPAILRQEPPLGQFERHLTVIASRILERNETTFVAPEEIVTTQALDAELLAVSQSMPSNFWRPANFHHLTLGAPETVLETVRLGVQVYYYGLLIHLHLPYMMHDHHSDSTNETDNLVLRTQQESSKITCVNASREIMTRFIAHRTFNPMSSCSRPVDFFALLAAMTILLAHLDAHWHRGAMSTNCLAHQRLSDRAMLEQALERMDVISQLNKDSTAHQSAALLRRLLDIEADTARGNWVMTPSGSGSPSVPGRGDAGRGGTDATHAATQPEGDHENLLPFSYLRAIWQIHEGPIARESWLDGSAASIPSASPTMDAPAPTAAPDTSTLPADIPASRVQTKSRYEEPCMSHYPRADDVTLQPPADLPALAPDINEWTFQGVDLAFFDSLMRGSHA